FAPATRRRASTRLSQRTCDAPVRRGLEGRRVARRLKPAFVFALRRRARPANVARSQTHGAPSCRMARRRMAGGRGGAYEVLALDPARGHAARGSRRRHQAALAHRTRLRRIEERTRPGSLRGARLAGIPSSRKPVHRSLRIPDPREIGFSPLSPPAPRKTCPFRPFSIPTPRRSVPNATWPTQSPQCESD